MTNRWKLWLGVSALAVTSGVLPGVQILSPVSSGMLGVATAGDAWAQESEEGEGAAPECATEASEGEEGGAVECPEPSGEGEEGEGEGG